MKKLLLITLLISVSLSAQSYSGGAGTEASPYQINTVEDLIYLSTHSGDWDKHFIQTANISFNEDETQVDWDGDGTATWDAGDQPGFLPIGDGTTTFTGTYNGDGHTISNLFISRSTEYVGLFGYINAGDIYTVKNLGVIQVNITGNLDHVGGLVGYNRDSYIINCFSTGNVSGGGNYIGGLVGENYSSRNYNCFSTCSVSGVARVGGLIGENTGSLIDLCYSIGSVSGSSNLIGGFVGFYDGGSTISNSYSMGNVTRSAGSGVAVGGFIGQLYSGTITNCYSTGSVSFTGASPEVQTNKGFAGYHYGGTFNNCFWDEETSGSTSSSGEGIELVGETNANMKTQSTFTSAGWDFTDVWVMSSTVTFNSYPTLKWTNAYSVSPTGNNIISVTNLVWLSENPANWGGSYTQTADINLWTNSSWNGGSGFSPIGNATTKFTGGYNGGGYAIANLSINNESSNYAGFFGYTEGAIIQNLGIVNCYIHAYNYIAGLAGRSASTTFTNCHSTGYIKGYGMVAGLVGYCHSSSSISNCYNECNVTGTAAEHAGLVGYLMGSSITNCYSTGSINGYNNSGGLVGSCNSSQIENSYSTGDVRGHLNAGGFVSYVSLSSNINNCYATGSVVGTSECIGGFTGASENSSSISKCYATGSVSGIEMHVGGFVGVHQASAVISNCYSLGEVSGVNGSVDVLDTYGGFCGSAANGATIEYSYSIGSVTFTSAEDPTNKGFLGKRYGEFYGPLSTLTDNFFDSEASNQNSDLYATARTTAQMKTQSTFTNWDFLSIWEIFPGFYPRLQSNPDPALPVELTSFKATISENNVILNWQTATEVNNYGFEIERCEKQEARSETWKKIGFVQGHGNSNSVKEYSFVDASTPLSASSISYRLKQIDNDGSFSYSDEIIVETLHVTSLPTEYTLEQNYPNPFNPSTTIKFGLPKDSKIVLEVFNIIGEKVTTLINGEMQAGIHNYQFSIDNYQLSSGIYIYKLTTEGFTSTKKFVLMK